MFIKSVYALTDVMTARIKTLKTAPNFAAALHVAATVTVRVAVPSAEVGVPSAVAVRVRI